MSNIKSAAIAVVGAVSLMLPLSAVAHAEAVTNLDVNQDVQISNLECLDPAVEVFDPTSDGCDLAVDKQVSINGGAFVEADTSADAAQAQVGDTVTWQITVTNDSSGGFVPTGKLTVNDVLPSGAAYDSYTASAGTYDGTNWTFDLSGNLPATLTITSHAVSTGLFKNTAVLSAYDPCLDGCGGAGVYADSNPDNNSNDAWFDPSAKPQVLATSTLVNTGSGTLVQTTIALSLIVATGLVTFAGRKVRL